MDLPGGACATARVEGIRGHHGIFGSVAGTDVLRPALAQSCRQRQKVADDGGEKAGHDMQHLMMDLTQARSHDLRAEADRERLVHLPRPGHRAGRSDRARRSGPGLLRRALALR